MSSDQFLYVCVDKIHVCRLVSRAKYIHALHKSGCKGGSYATVKYVEKLINLALMVVALKSMLTCHAPESKIMVLVRKVQ